MTTKLTIEAIADRTEILERLYAYCRHADRGDAAGMAAQFVEDCAVDLFPDAERIVRGSSRYRDSLVPLLGKVVAGTHYISNPEYEFTGPDEAMLHTYMYSWQRFVPDMKLPDRHRMGRYEVRAVRTEEGWRLAALRLIVAAEDGGDRQGEHVGRPWPFRLEDR